MNAPKTLGPQLLILARTLDDLLFWARIPAPEPLSEGWLSAFQGRVREQCQAITKSVPDDNRDAVTELLTEAERCASELAAAMQSNPELSTARYSDWFIPEHCELYGTLRDVHCDVLDLAKDFDPSLNSEHVSLPLGDEARRLRIALRELKDSFIEEEECTEDADAHNCMDEDYYEALNASKQKLRDELSFDLLPRIRTLRGCEKSGGRYC